MCLQSHACKHVVVSDRRQISADFMLSAVPATNTSCQTSSACGKIPVQAIPWFCCCLLGWAVVRLSIASHPHAQVCNAWRCQPLISAQCVAAKTEGLSKLQPAKVLHADPRQGQGSSGRGRAQTGPGWYLHPSLLHRTGHYTSFHLTAPYSTPLHFASSHFIPLYFTHGV